MKVAILLTVAVEIMAIGLVVVGVRSDSFVLIHAGAWSMLIGLMGWWRV